MDAPGSARDATITLSVRDRELIQRHGYPFARLNADLVALAASLRSSNIAIDPFELERLVGDLSYSTNHCPDDALKIELNDLCERLECAELRSRLWNY
jgi:hypothetical protein